MRRSGAQWGLAIVLLVALAPVAWNAWNGVRARWMAETQAQRLVTFGDEALAAGDVAKALTAYQRARELDPVDPGIREALAGAQARLVADDPSTLNADAAVALELELALREDAGRPVDRALALGYAARVRGDAERARTWFQKAIERDGDDARAHLALGLLHLDEQRTDEAIAALQRAADLAPEAWRPRQALGTALVRAQKWARAEEELARAAELRRDPAILTALADARLRLEKFEAAATALNAALALLPDEASRAPVRQKLGFALYRLERYADAVRELRLAAAQSPDPVTLHNLGVAYQGAGEHALAVDAFGRALAGEPGNGDAHARRVASLIALGRLDEAAAAADFLRRIAQGRPDLTAAVSRVDQMLVQARGAHASRPAAAPEGAEP